MKAIQKTQSKKLLSERVTAMEGDPRGALATWGRRMAMRTRSIFIVLRQGILSLYSYLTSRRIFTLWRSRTYIQNLRHVRIAGLSSSFLLGLLALAIIIPLYNVTGTEDTEAATAYNEASITLTSSSTTATITADAATLGSTGIAFIASNLSTASQYASYSITTTNATGYTIGIATDTSSTSTNLTSGDNTLSSLAYNDTTKNGLTSSSYNTDAYDNTWALYPGTVGNSANSKFYPISSNTITMGTTSEANDINNTYKVGIAARITMAQASGTYTTTAGNFKVTAVGNPAAYTIAYNANGGDESTLPNPNPESSTSYSQQSVTLSSTTPTKTGYDFLGWCTKQTSDQTTQSNGSTACTNAGGTYYSAGGYFYIDETTTNITTLYAIWYLKDITVTGVFVGSGVTGITFTHDTYDDKSITTNNGTTTLKYGVSYTITGSYSSGYEFSSWAATAGTLGSATTASTTYSTTTAATLTLTGKSSCTPVGSLYCTIASMSKGNFDMSTISTSLTTANSGVYKYTGSHSDNGSSDVYFYRGIIDSSFTNSSAGSSGDGTLYPNYVKLTTTVSGTTYNTCWRIFRTTASGGVKMIYNGLWTGSTCANATTNAQLSSTAYYNRGNPSTFGSDYYGTKGFIAYAGYNYNRNYAYNNTGNTTAISNDTLFTNGTASNIRTTVENWYTSTIDAATNSLLESNAGYCNDRSTYNTSNTETTTTIPYAPSTQTNFGALDRNYVKTSPSLACPYPSRDLLTTSKGLGYPVALITIDEAVLAGNGYSNKEAYAATSYLTSGSYFWSLSPYFRSSNGNVNVVYVRSNGVADFTYVGDALSVRPVISLKFGTTPESGSGTATDPWVVTPPPTMQSIAVSDVAEGEEVSLADERDYQIYTVKKINGYLWMTRNLAIGCNGSGSSYGDSVSSKPLTSSNSNVSSDWSTPIALLSAASSNTQTADYTNPRMQCSSTYGAWYNYVAATAGTITGSADYTTATKDICPAGWHLPTGPNTTSGTDINKLVGNNTSGWQSATTGLTAFGAVAGGDYDSGLHNATWRGYWWSATANDTTIRYGLYYDSSNGQFYGNGGDYRYVGYFVRCVRMS